MVLNFTSYEEMIWDAGLFAEQLPKHDIVLAIPRSGLIPASIIAERWHVPISTPSLMRMGAVLEHGARLAPPKYGIQSMLVIDDTCNTGKEMAKARELLKDVKNAGVKITYACLYASNPINQCDISFRIIPQPRIFEWNWTHHNVIDNSCTDMDGVLCRAPHPFENDYGPNYEIFLDQTEPRYIPSKKLKAIITGRLEKYRKQTENWLNKHGVQYGELIMRPNATIEHCEHKANNLREKYPKTLFIEDDTHQAKIIHDMTGQPVLCVTDWKVHQK